MDINIPGENFPRFKKPQFGAILAIFLFAFVFSSIGTLIYQVEPDEVGVVQRFGKYVNTTQPGLHMKLPFGIETVKKVRVTHVFKEEFGFRSMQSGGTRTNYARTQQGYTSPFDVESLMLTGDLNVADVEWIVQYKVKDPILYAFNVRNAKDTLRNVTESMMNLVIGDHSINEVLTIGRENIAKSVHEKLQLVLDQYQSGIIITNVVLQDVTPPDLVRPSFNEVNEAKQEKEKMINQAWEDYNKAVPRARGEADKLIRQAEGFSLDRVNRAQGDAQNFTQIWQAYKDSKDVTRTRLYLEAMQKVWSGVKEKYIIDPDAKGIIPFFEINKAIQMEPKEMRES